jgi:hypothetical protein
MTLIRYASGWKSWPTSHQREAHQARPDGNGEPLERVPHRSGLVHAGGYHTDSAFCETLGVVAEP